MGKKKETIKMSPKELLIFIIFIIIVDLVGYFLNGANNENNEKDVGNGEVVVNAEAIDLGSIPEYTNSPYVSINNNVPSFTKSDITVDAFETYSDLDSLGRCGVAYANVCKEIMPAEGEERQSISMIKPTGWKTAKYEGLVEGNYLYNRCHLIAYQLAGENANEKNLITGTRYFNVNGMLPFENKVHDYIVKNKKNHVLYRVTPIFDGNNLVANGVQMEAYSVEDNGQGISFNVYVYNVQPGISIDYSTGTSKIEK